MKRGEEIRRRSFFGALLAAGGGWIAAVFGIPAVRASLFPLWGSGEQANWSDAGPIENFGHSAAPVSQLVSTERPDGWQVATSEQIVYVIAGAKGSTGAPRVLSSICPHLGCTVQWRPEKNEFICPCHGGTYAPDGSRISGPPARGMDELPAKVEHGHLYVRLERFQQLLATKVVAD